MAFIESFVEILRVIFGLALLFFIPGFAATWALYVRKDEIPVITRAGLSFVLSLATVMLSTLFLDNVIGVDTTPLNIVITLVVFIVLMVLVWEIRIQLGTAVHEKSANQ